MMHPATAPRYPATGGAPRQRGSAVLGWAAGAAALLLALAGGSAALEQLRSGDWFPLQTVRLDSAVQYLDPADLEEALDPFLDRGMFGLDVTGMRRAAEQLPWVASASVRRVWPDTVELSIREQAPLARWGDSALINRQAEVFRPHPDSFPGDLPRLVGVSGHEEELVAGYRQLARRFASVGFELAVLERDARGAWRAELLPEGDDEGERSVHLEMGRDQLEARVARFLEAWPLIAREQSRELASADLRYPNGFALGWRDADTATE
ncbi:cell division protein FtsQ [Alkalispirillum mobile]|uniref:Cell division protein FtsQ n=1 Tax=Alkalispirillum mobile TaxID=85925 RepID=A0A498BSB5_9GAMM|nr:cell division protein FtsQ/DivIB [Alkalispirillum mobile]RLK46854.1 cell division protein FtsQ [Alkalispirillum mobile]